MTVLPYEIRLVQETDKQRYSYKRLRYDNRCLEEISSTK
jgi:hypothetical protein